MGLAMQESVQLPPEPVQDVSTSADGGGAVELSKVAGPGKEP